MEQLAGSNVQVVLSLKEGKDFDRISNPTCIVATLNGQSLETVVVEPDSYPQYKTDLVWKADKNLLRRMRSSQEPLKLECFEIKENGRKDKIGHALLTLRSAQVVPKVGDFKIKSNWYKLYGLRNDIKISKPQLLIALTIEEHETFVRRISQQEITPDREEKSKIHSARVSKEIDRPCTQEKTNMVELESAATCSTLFLLNIIAGTAKNLHLLKMETDDPFIGNYSLRYRIFGRNIELKSFSNLEKTWTLDERVVVQIRSSPNVFKSYLEEEPNLLLILQYRDTILGHSEIDLRPLVRDRSMRVGNDSERRTDAKVTTLNHRCMLTKATSIKSAGDCQNEDIFIDLQMLLRCVDTVKKDLIVPQYGDKEKAKVGNISEKISCTKDPVVKSTENLEIPMLDNDLAYKIVDELESWKERQQEIFRVELKRKEEQHLNRLSEEWQKRRENLESKLACSVQQCKMLANNLNRATEDLRTRRFKSLEKEARLIKANEELQWRFDGKVRELQEIQEASERMREEIVSKLNLDVEEKKQLKAEIEALRRENEQNRKLLKKQSQEIEAHEKGSLTKDQTASLLQEVKRLEQELNSAQKSKSFFKEKWGKAVREIHKMKMEHQNAIQVQIKTSKEQLKNFDFEGMLTADSKALTNDKILLNEIQKEMDIIKPTASFLRKETASQEILGAIDTLYSTRQASKSHRSFAMSDNCDEPLRKLIEQRDDLLKTGSYTNDDAIIMKLNAEIRSLMAPY